MPTYKFPVNKNKERILNVSNTRNVILQNTPKVILSDKIDSINTKITRINNEMDNDNITIDNQVALTSKKYKKFTVVKDTNKNVYISKKDDIYRYSFNDSDNWLRLSPYTENRCIVKNTYNGGNHSYDTNGKYTLDEISQMIARDEYYGYINNGDWFELETNDWKFKFIINIDIYRNTDPNTPNKPNNIDLICVECVNRSGNTSGMTPWGTNKPIIPTIFDNPKLHSGYTPIILSNFTNALWDNFIPPLLVSSNNQGFGSEFISHIVDKYKTTVARNFNKEDLKSSNNNTDAGIYDQANLGKIWFLYESEIIDQPIFSTTTEGMTCQQYPMFKKAEYRIFKFNNNLCSIMTSTLRNGTFDPLYIEKGFSKTYQPSNGYFPMFGMRFV